jgi:nicotinate-nucleotide pyrophosphorylase (carboxylating)
MNDKELYKLLEEEIRTIDLSTVNTEMNKGQEIAIIALEDTVVSGINIVKNLLKIVDEEAIIKVINPDGFFIEENDIIAIIKAKMATLLQVERLIHNVIESMSAIASKVNFYVKQLSDTNVKLIDTRHNVPGSRYITKLAFLDGGGINHYGNLSDHVFLNSRHKALYGSFSNAINIIKNNIDQNIKCTIEVDNENDFFDAIKSDCQIVTMKEFSAKEVSKLLDNNHYNQLIELRIDSNNQQFNDYIHTGIDFISVSEITKGYDFKKILIKYIK